MTKHYGMLLTMSQGPTEPSAERRFADEFALMGESMGMPRMTGRLWGWLLICEPAAQSSAQLAEVLGVSRASISIATRLLMASGLVRRTTRPGDRSTYFEIDVDALARMPAGEMFGALRRQLDRGLAALPDPTAPRAERLRRTRDFYAYVEREVPNLIQEFRREHVVEDPTA